jgi:hypothetical protein
MQKITLERFAPGIQEIIQWANAFNYEEEYKRANKYLVTPKQENIKVVKQINLSINDDTDDIFNIIELKPTTLKQEQKIKCIDVSPTNNDNKLPLKFVKYQNSLIFFNSDVRHDYLYFSKDLPPYIKKDGKTEYPKLFTEVKKQDINLFIDQYLNKNNNLYEIITDDNQIKFYIDIDKEISNSSIDDQNYVLNKVIEFIYIQFKNLLKIEVDKKEIIILNSSTDKTISFHLIYNNIILKKKKY